MLRYVCTFAQRTCRASGVKQVRKCREIRGESSAKTLIGSRNYCVKPGIVVDEKLRDSPASATPFRGYGSAPTDNSKTENDMKEADTKGCARIEGTNSITAVPELINNWKDRTQDEDIELKLPDALDECIDDVSHIGPYSDPPRTFAYIADSSNTVQQLIKLGVKLYKLEKDYEIFKQVSELDFERGIKPTVQLLHDIGVHPDQLGDVISNCPQLLTSSLVAINSRLRYLKEHKFTKEMIVAIIEKRPNFLLLNIKLLDAKLGSLQHLFQLTGDELRGVVSHQPRLITCPERKLLFAVAHIRNVLKFNRYQLKQLVLTRPSVFVRHTDLTVETCTYAMEKMNLEHKDIMEHSEILLCKKPRLENRHMFLVELKKAQYDPTLPGYIPPSKLVQGSDEVFCKEVANCNIDLYNAFLKTF